MLTREAYVSVMRLIPCYDALISTEIAALPENLMLISVSCYILAQHAVTERQKCVDFFFFFFFFKYFGIHIFLRHLERGTKPKLPPHDNGPLGYYQQ